MSRIHLGRRFYVHGRRIGWLAGKLKMRGWIAEASRHRRRRQNELPYNEKTTERYIRATRTEFHFYATLYISLPADVSVFDHRPPASFIINTRLFIIVIFLIRPAFVLRARCNLYLLLSLATAKNKRRKPASLSSAG